MRRESREEVEAGDKEEQLPSSDKSGLEEEFAPIDVEDTSSFLETLDNEVSIMVRERMMVVSQVRWLNCFSLPCSKMKCLREKVR